MPIFQPVRQMFKKAHRSARARRGAALGLDHFEGRSWQGLHRHALMTMLAFTFLQYRRLKNVRWGKKNPRTAASTKLAGRSSRMDYFAGLDVSVKDTSVCIVDDAGRIVREVKVASEPAALLAVLRSPSYRFKRIGLEAGPLSQWLFSALAETGLPVICVETRHMRAVLKAQINKTDRNDDRGIAQMMRVGLYRPVHVKTLRSQKLRMLLTHRKLLQAKAIAVENDLRATLRNFGLKVGVVGTVKFEARIKELVENVADLAALVEPLLVVRRVLREQIAILRRRVLAAVRDDEVCRRLMTIPGVGPVVALTYRATVDVPARFRKSKSVGAVFGLTPARDQSGERDRPGAISRCGDEMMRTAPYEAAQVMLLRSAKWSWLKAWAMKIAISLWVPRRPC
jgi:transposase